MKKITLFLMMAVSFISCDKSEVVDYGTNVRIEPTWREAFHYANQSASSQVWWTILGIIGFVVLALFIIKVAKSPGFGGDKPQVIMAVILALSIVSILAKPVALKTSNTRTVSKEYYDKVGQTYIMDSVFKANRMINANSK